MKTLKAFTAASNIDASLIRAVVRQSGGWSEFADHAQDVANHGADGGFCGFIYYSDTVKFAERNKSTILTMANTMASELDADTAAGLIAGFNCVHLNKFEVYNALHCYNPKVDDSDDYTTVMNALAWFALEEVARAYVDFEEGGV